MTELRTVHRITMLPVVSEEGDVGPSLFIFKGTRLTYRRVVRKGLELIVLPANSLITCYAEFVKVDTVNILNWAGDFFSSVRHLTLDDIKPLLIYEGYCRHMSYEVLK
eukprot:IDg13628t1